MSASRAKCSAVGTGLSRREPRQTAKGFTLIEVLVVVAIIALLISILLPSLATARREARKTICMANQRSIGHGYYFYTNAYLGYLPASHEWHCKIRPFLKASLFTKAVSTPPPIASPGGLNFYEVEVFNCPEDVIKNARSMGNNWLPDCGATQISLLFSYAANENASWPLHYSPEKAAQLQDYSVITQNLRWLPGVVDIHGEHVPINMRKLTSFRRPSDTILLTDAGDKEVGVSSGAVPNCGSADRARWDYDDDYDRPSADLLHGEPALEVHHKTGNPFLFADEHVSYYKVIKGAVRDGVPTVPHHWVPEAMNVAPLP